MFVKILRSSSTLTNQHPIQALNGNPPLRLENEDAFVLASNVAFVTWWACKLHRQEDKQWL
jgi:hypothetical protein